MQLRILLVDSQNLFRAGIGALLKELSEYKVIGEAATGMQALRLIEEEKPDIVLMELALPELHGLEVLTRCVKEFPQTRVVILSTDTSEKNVLRALRNGAHGFLSKNSLVSELDLALQAAARGEIFVTSGVSQHLVNSLNRKGAAHTSRHSNWVDPYESLTRRQRQVLQLISEGHSTNAIAKKMGLSPKTVKTYRVQLMRQLEIHSIAKLVHYAVRAGILKLE